MSIPEDSLHKLVDLAGPSDIPTADEIEAIEQSKEELARGEFYREKDIDWDEVENVDWDNLDSINLD